MNEIPVHPMLVHLPIALSVIMPFLLGGLLLAIKRDWLPERAWWIGVLLQAVLVTGCAMALVSGHSEEERVEESVPHAAIEAHENLAKTMTGAAVITLVISAAGLRTGARSRLFQITSLAASVIVFALAGLTGHEGGELIYKHGAAGVNPAGSQQQKNPASSEEEENENDHR